MSDITPLADGERQLAINYALKGKRGALLSLWQLDETLGRIVATTTEPMVGQMRLTWWHERLCGLDVAESPAEPLLGALAGEVCGHDVTGAMLAAMIEGWEAVLDPLPLGRDALAIHAIARGGRLFASSAAILGGEAEPGGEGWALIDFARRCSDKTTAELAWRMAGERPIPRRNMAKPLRILAHLASVRSTRPFAALHEPLSRWTLLRAVL